MNSGIYKILNKITGKIYIGSAIVIADRWVYHKWELDKNRHGNKYLQRAWNKYQAFSFDFIIIELCEKDKLLEREQYWLTKTKCYERHIGYNILATAYSHIGAKRSMEAKLRMSAWQKGTTLNDDQIDKMRAGKRNIIKWPHADGSRCKCHECKYKKSERSLAWLAKKSNMVSVYEI